MPFGKAFVYQAPKRKKSEVYWSGLSGVVLAADTDYNLVTLAKGLPAPNFGTLAPFFNTLSDKLNAYNDDASMSFKLNLTGTWSAGTENRSLQLDFLGTNGNRLVASRDAAVVNDVVTLATFFSIDRNGGIVTNGSSPIIRSNGGSYTITAMLLIAEQATRQTQISAV
jgi:hypothetical protein